MAQELAVKAGAGVVALLSVVWMSAVFDGAAGDWDRLMLVAGLLSIIGLAGLPGGRAVRARHVALYRHEARVDGEPIPSVIYGTRAETGARRAGRGRGFT